MLEEIKTEVKSVEEIADTQPASPVEDKPVEKTEPQEKPENPAGEEQVKSSMFTDEQKEKIKELMRERVNRTHSRFFERYGVKDIKGLDELFDKSNKFEELSQKVEQLTSENASLTEKLTFLKNNIDPAREEDIRRYFKGGDVPLNESTLIEALPSHPEWIKNVPTDNHAKTTIKTLTPSRGHEIPETEDEKMERIFGHI